jgi:hypothetical protein
MKAIRLLACHFYDQGITVMPLLYNLQFQHIPDILQQLVCLDVSGDVSLWTDRFLESLSIHIRSTLSVISSYNISVIHFHSILIYQQTF